MHAPKGVRIRARRLRRFVAIAAAGVLAGVLAMNGIAAIDAPGSAAAAADDAVAPGTGASGAQTIKIDPTAGSLSVGVTLGGALAGHQNNKAQAQSTPVDLGVIGTSLTSASCGGSSTLQPNQLPQPLMVSSTDPGAANGQTGTYAGVFNESAKANNTPFADAVTTIQPVGIPGVLEVGSGRAEATSGLVNGQRVATATVDISSVTLAGVIALNGLHWAGVYSSGTKTTYNGQFTVGNLTIGGNPVPTQDPEAVVTALNNVLGALGVVIQWPTAHLNGNALFVDPLTISVVPNSGRDALTGAVLNAIAPVQQPAFNQLIQNMCQSSSAITVFDIALGSVTGAGSFNLELGGVNATTGTITESDFLGGGGDSTPEVGGASSGSIGGGTTGGSNLGSLGGSTGDLGAGPTALSGTNNAASPAHGATPAAAHEKLPPGVRGGALAAVAGGVLGLMALLAEGDRRKMRKAQRQIPIGF